MAERQLKRHMQFLEAEQKRLIQLLPLSNYGPIRVPKHIDAKIVLGKAKEIRLFGEFVITPLL